MIGTKLSHYEITAHLGSGGMGDVYRATDLKLKRSVAIKLLPAEFASDSERLSRFRREAQLLASLNHPNIAHIYGLEESDGKYCIAMELVEGETLQARLKRGPIPIDESLSIAKQICEALEAAHEKGVIHRDLKPGNVMLTGDGKVKVLDFGLAKAYETDVSNAGLSNSPTMVSMAATNAGVILGTAAYMSPEQAKGRKVDRRTDIFAFGCVLYEMITGHPAFDGDDVTDILGAILRMEPDYTAIPSDVPPSVRRLLRLCLEKNVKNRRADATDLRLDLEMAIKEPDTAVTSAPSVIVADRPPSRVAWIVAAAALLIAAILAVPAARYFFRTPEEPVLRRFALDAPVMQNLYQLALSPNGRRLAYVARSGDGTSVALWLRPMDALTAQILPGTNGSALPFWSPDSRFIAFFSGADRKLKKIDTLGGNPQTICDIPGTGPGLYGGTWSDSGIIVLSSGTVLYRVSSAGGVPTKLTELDASKHETNHYWPQFIPNSDRFLFSSWSAEEANRAIYAASLDGSKPVRLVTAASMAGFASPGYLVYQVNGTLMAQRFDPRRLQTDGEAIPVAESLSNRGANGRSSFTLSREGTLAFTTGGTQTAQSQLSWYDRSGKPVGLVGNPDQYSQIRLSPDEKRIAYVRRTTDSGLDLWLLDASSGIASRFTADPGDEDNPIWSPDSRQVAFNSMTGGKQDIYVKTVGTDGENLLFSSDEPKWTDDWSKDGKSILFRTTGLHGISALSLAGDHKASVLFKSTFTQDEERLSPDGRWIAFESTDTGKPEVYIASFPAFTDRRQVSNAGGSQPHWRGDGRELFYLGADSKMMSVEVKTGANLETGVPKALFQTKIRFVAALDQFDVTSNGQKVLLMEPVDQATASSTPITIVLNWTSLLKK